MALGQERMKMKQRVEVDSWSVKEQLCLASAVLRSGDQNWMTVSRMLRPFSDSSRPPEWYSQKNCAVQYSSLLENVETPKRKKRNEKGESQVETPSESILRKLTQERLEELKRTMQEKRVEFMKLKEEMTLVKNGHADDRLDELCHQIDEEKKQKEKLAEAHALWLKEREKLDADRAWKPLVPPPFPHRRKVNRNVARRNSNQSDPSSEADSPLSEPLNVDVINEDTSEVVVEPKPPPATPTSPLLTSLLKSPSPAPTSQSSSILHSAITSHRGSSPTITSLLNSAPGIPASSSSGTVAPPSAVSSSLKNLVSSAISGAGTDHPPATTPSPAAGAPTLSMLLELPPSLPGKPLPELPSTITPPSTLATANEEVCHPQHEELRVRRETGTDEHVEVVEVDTARSKEEPVEVLIEEETKEQLVEENTKHAEASAEERPELKESSAPEAQVVEKTDESKDTQDVEPDQSTATEEPVQEEAAEIPDLANMEVVILGKVEEHEQEETAPEPHSTQLMEGEEATESSKEESPTQDTSSKSEEVEPVSTTAEIEEEPPPKERKCSRRDKEESTAEPAPSEESVPAPKSEDVAPKTPNKKDLPAKGGRKKEDASKERTKKEEEKADSTKDAKDREISPKEDSHAPRSASKKDMAKDKKEAKGNSGKKDIHRRESRKREAKSEGHKKDSKEESHKKEVTEDKEEQSTKKEKETSDRDMQKVVEPEVTNTPEPEEPKKKEPKRKESAGKKDLSKKEPKEEAKKENLRRSVSREDKKKDGSKTRDEVKSKKRACEDEPKAEVPENKKKTCDDDSSEEPEVKDEAADVDKEAAESVRKDNTESTKKEVVDSPEDMKSEDSSGTVDDKADKVPPRPETPSTEDDKTNDAEPQRGHGKKRLGASTPSDSVPNSPAASITEEEREYRVWKKSIMLLYGRLATHKYASLFLRPITDDQAPGYSSLVHRPIDLLMIKKNIETGVTRTTSEFQRDVMLMFSNSIMYNKSSHFVNRMACQMQEECLQHIQDFLMAQMLVQTVGETPHRRETRTTEANKHKDILSTPGSASQDEGELSTGGKRKRVSESEKTSKKRKLDDPKEPPTKEKT